MALNIEYLPYPPYAPDLAPPVILQIIKIFIDKKKFIMYEVVKTDSTSFCMNFWDDER